MILVTVTVIVNDNLEFSLTKVFVTVIDNENSTGSQTGRESSLPSVTGKGQVDWEKKTRSRRMQFHVDDTTGRCREFCFGSKVKIIGLTSHRDVHGLDSSMDWIGLGPMTVMYKII